jgi:hypothetical protein
LRLAIAASWALKHICVREGRTWKRHCVFFQMYACFYYQSIRKPAAGLGELASQSTFLLTALLPLVSSACPPVKG